MKKQTILLLLLFVLGFSLAGCGGETTSISEEEKQLREVVLTDYKIEPNHLKISYKRPVRFIVKNLGNFTHEFKLLTEPPASVEVAPNSKDYLDITFEKPGDYEVICPKHEANEMKGTLIVEEADLEPTENVEQKAVEPESEQAEPEAPAVENKPNQEQPPQEEKKSGPIFD